MDTPKSYTCLIQSGNGMFLIIKACIVWCVVVHTDVGWLQSQRGPGKRRGGAGSLWSAELVPDGLAWQLLCDSGTWTGQRGGVLLPEAAQQTVGEVETPDTSNRNSFTKCKLCLSISLPCLCCLLQQYHWISIGLHLVIKKSNFNLPHLEVYPSHTELV